MNHNQKYLGNVYRHFIIKYIYEKRRTALYHPPDDFGIQKKLEQCLGGTYSQITAKCSHWKLLNDTGEPCLA